MNTQNNQQKIALYGLGTETERYISAYGETASIVGLLDGFCTEGELYGYPIISFEEAIASGVTQIVVIARPGSCKVIAKRIGERCRQEGIALFDVRGKDLLLEQKVSYDLRHVNGESRAALLEKIKRADVVSFDLFDTLVMRKVMYYTDVFELVEERLRERGIAVPGLAGMRLAAEKELSKLAAPTLEQIYGEVLKSRKGWTLSEGELAELEWQIDLATLIIRPEVCEIFHEAVAAGKRVVITTDCYYRKERICWLLEQFGLVGYEKLFVSCEYGTSKRLNLFHEVTAYAGEARVLHIGDDEVADIECAARAGFETYRIYSGSELFDLLGSLGADREIKTLSDRVKTGLFISRLFANPFWFEDAECRVAVAKAFDIGYLFCAPVIVDFVLWLRRKMQAENVRQVLFCARDGYLVEQLFRRLDVEAKAVYFLTSRTAAVRAGMECEADIAYVDGMKYFGSLEENTRVRFGIDLREMDGENRSKYIVERAKLLKANYRKYIESLDLFDDTIGVFDFVAKGTTQLYLQKLFEQHLKGFYFLQLEPEFMKRKGLDIVPFYSDAEKDTSVIFDCYYVLETILTAPCASIEEFDEAGNPVYAKETRSEPAIQCISKVQDGVKAYFDEYTELLPEATREENKKLDEVFLSTLSKLKILEEEFLALMVEDPFFGRMTEIKTVME